MITIALDLDQWKYKVAVEGVLKQDLPHVVGKAIGETATELMGHLRKQAPLFIERPVDYTVRGIIKYPFGRTNYHREDLSAVVGVDGGRTWYMRHVLAESTLPRHARRKTIPSPNTPAVVDWYGNIPRTFVKKIMPRLQRYKQMESAYAAFAPDKSVPKRFKTFRLRQKKQKRTITIDLGEVFLIKTEELKKRGWEPGIFVRKNNKLGRLITFERTLYSRPKLPPFIVRRLSEDFVAAHFLKALLVQSYRLSR